KAAQIKRRVGPLAGRCQEAQTSVRIFLIPCFSPRGLCDPCQKRIPLQTFQSFNRSAPRNAAAGSSRSNRSTAPLLRSKRLTRDNSNCNCARRLRLPALRRVARCVRLGASPTQKGQLAEGREKEIKDL